MHCPRCGYNPCPACGVDMGLGRGDVEAHYQSHNWYGKLWFWIKR